MCVEDWSDNVVLVSFSNEAEVGEALADAADRMGVRDDCDLVVDCSGLEHMDCACRRWLLELNDALNSRGHRMVLCGHRATLSKALNAPAFLHTMGFASDRFTALARLGLP